MSLSKLEQSLKDRNLIDIGDRVNVTTDVSNFDGVVKYKSCATGDCWIFEEINGNIRYVQNYIEIIKYKVYTEKEKKDLPF